MITLKICPFCGEFEVASNPSEENPSKPYAKGLRLIERGLTKEGRFQVYCESCGALGPEDRVRATAKHLWNKRVG